MESFWKAFHPFPAFFHPAVLLIAHGLAEHSGRYMNVVNHFVPKGYAVYGLDHIGHGKSSGKRVYVERFEDFSETLKTYVDMVCHWQPEKPIFLVGHNMGGLISSVYLLTYQAGLRGTVLSGLAVKVPDKLSPVILFVSRVLSMLLPRVGLIQLLILQGSADRLVDPPGAQML